MIYDVDINAILVPHKVSFGENGFKYFIGYKDSTKVRPLYVMLPKLVHTEEIFGELLEKYNEI